MPYGKSKTNFTTIEGCRLVMRANRCSMGYSIRELAKKINYSSSYIGEIEKGTCNVSIDVAKVIANALQNPRYWEIAETFKFKKVSNKGDMEFIGCDGTLITIDRNSLKEVLDIKEEVSTE